MSKGVCGHGCAFVRAWARRIRAPCLSLSDRVHIAVITCRGCAVAGIVDLAAYLALYNLASAVGWFLILRTTFDAYRRGDDAAALYKDIEGPLKIVQSAAILEVVHAALGLVRSPVVTTAIQVASRLLLVWAYTVPHVANHGHWSLYLMVGR